MDGAFSVSVGHDAVGNRSVEIDKLVPFTGASFDP